MSKYIDQFSELLSNPLGDLISSIGKGVGEAQAALDAGSLAQTLEIYKEGNDDEKEKLKLLREIGYQPTFYVIPETEVEAQVSISLGISGNEPESPIQSGYQSRVKMFATPLNAGNVNRYNLNANASAKLKFKIVPVPPDAIISEIRPVPDLTDKSFKDAKELLESFGLNYKLPEGIKEIELDINTTTITSTIPEAKERVRLGDVIQLFFPTD